MNSWYKATELCNIIIYWCSEVECSDEQDDDDHRQETITDMEDEITAVTISRSVPVTGVINTTHRDHNLSLPIHHHCQQHSGKGYSPNVQWLVEISFIQYRIRKSAEKIIYVLLKTI